MLLPMKLSYHKSSAYIYLKKKNLEEFNEIDE
jgi:hypothetical protein